MLKRQRRGFTLIELLVVIAIIAVLIGLLLPAVQKVREAANRMKCSNNLKQMVLGAHNYESTFSQFPPGAGQLPTYAVNGTTQVLPSPTTTQPAAQRPSPQALILPYLEQANKYNQFNFDRDVHGDNANAAARTQDVPIFLCPSDPSSATFAVTLPSGATAAMGRGNYHASIGNDSRPTNKDGTTGGLFYVEFTSTQWKTLLNRPGAVKIGDVSDGTSNTAMFAEIKRGNFAGTRNPPVEPWDCRNLSPNAIPVGTNAALQVPPTTCDSMTQASLGYSGLQYHRSFANTSFYTHTVPPNYQGGDCTDLSNLHLAARSFHSGGVNVGLCDGSIRFVAQNIDPLVWRIFGSRADGQVLQLP